jgi:hypothetical protein
MPAAARHLRAIGVAGSDLRRYQKALTVFADLAFHFFNSPVLGCNQHRFEQPMKMFAHGQSGSSGIAVA